jgi:hypothetical protein
MPHIGLWRVHGDDLHRLEVSPVDTEVLLEGWIERDPSLLQSGLAIVGRQVAVEGNRLDLLGLDFRGAWVVIEIKRDALHRDTIAQALDYASLISSLPADQLRRIADDYLTARGQTLAAILEQRHATLDDHDRDVSIAVVGTGRDAALDRVAAYLADRYGLLITVVSFDVFTLPDGMRLLARESVDMDQPSGSTAASAALTPEHVARLADATAIGHLFREFLQVTADLGLYARAWKTCVMFTPPTMRNRALFTVWAQPDNGLVSAWIGVKPFAEFFAVSVDEVARYLGEEGWRTMTAAQVHAFLAGLRGLFDRIHTPPPSVTETQSSAQPAPAPDP